MKDIAVFWLSVLLVVALLVIFNGCAAKTVYVDRIVEVKVPVPCKSKEVQRAIRGSNDAVTTLDIVRERDELREAVNACK